MQSLTTALENLLRHLSQEIPATPGIRVIDIPFPLKDAFDALSWLASQQTYPQFYWQLPILPARLQASTFGL